MKGTLSRAAATIFISTIFTLCHLKKDWSAMQKGRSLSAALKKSQCLSGSGTQVQQQENVRCLCMITAEINGSALSASNCFCPFFFLMDEERDSTLSSAVPLLPTTVNLSLKVTSLARRWLGEGFCWNGSVPPPPNRFNHVGDMHISLLLILLSE